MKLVNKLNLKPDEKLTCVYQMVHNAIPVTLSYKAKKTFSLSGMLNKIFNTSLSVSMCVTST